MADTNVTHEDAVNAVRKALVDAATVQEGYNKSISYEELLKAAQAYELTTRAATNY